MRNFYLAAFVVLLLSSVALAYSCTDSDGGKNYNVKGTITYYVNGVQYTLTDTCDSSPAYADLMVFERYCLDDGGTAGLTYFCPNGCSDGACINTTTSSPDLIVSDMTFNPLNPKSSDLIKINITVKNIGTATAGSSVLQVNYDPGSYTRLSVPSLVPGANHSWLLSWALSAHGL